MPIHIVNTFSKQLGFALIKDLFKTTRPCL